ncbi:MAG: hypothetical protein CSA70_10005 [Rhodobacterales bacterium]|nr:MAG: hypothetical protein CSA70_10005 [Rhodobacterales bacterium]
MYNIQRHDTPWPDQAGDTYEVSPRCFGLGEDVIIGGAIGPCYRSIDLSALTFPVNIYWKDNASGVITDGADSIVFQGVDHIILPDCMAE